MEAPREDVEMGNDEDEKQWEAEVPRARMSPKNPTSREKQEHEDSGHAVHRHWCAASVACRGVGGQHRSELLEEEEREKTTPTVAFHYGFMTQEKQTRFQFCCVETAGMVKRERLVVDGKVPQHTPCHILWVSSKILVCAESF